MFPSMMLIMNGLSIAIHVGRCAPGGSGANAGRRYDGLLAVCHADRFLLPDDVDDVHHHPARFGFRRAHRRGAGYRADHPRPANPANASPSLSRARSSSAMSASATPARRKMCSHDISFTAHPGQTTAFIGSTGSGKSTVVNLIPRFYDVTAGSDPASTAPISAQVTPARPARQNRLHAAEEHALLRHD